LLPDLPGGISEKAAVDGFLAGGADEAIV